MPITGYERALQDQIHILAKTERPVVLFGAMSLGRMAQSALKHLGKPAVCFCDNQAENLSEQGKLQDGRIQGLPVLSPEEAFQRYPQAIVVACAFYKESRIAMEAQSKALGFQTVLQPQALMYEFQTNVLSRGIGAGFSHRLTETLKCLQDHQIEDEEEQGGKLIFEQVAVIVTDRCNLKCRYCSNGVPYITSPSHFDAQTCVKALKNFCNSVDAVNFCTIMGGESLMHPQIVEICEEAANIGNIFQIAILTNGSWLPKEALLEKLAKYLTKILITDYGPLVSNKKEELGRLCEKYNLVFEDKPEYISQWYDFGRFQKHSRSSGENDALYYECRKNKRLNCPTIYKDKFSLCGNSLLGAHWSVPLPDRDFIDLLDAEKDKDERREDIVRLLKKETALTACGYCNGYHGALVTPGEQI